MRARTHALQAAMWSKGDRCQRAEFQKSNRNSIISKGSRAQRDGFEMAEAVRNEINKRSQGSAKCEGRHQCAGNLMRCEKRKEMRNAKNDHNEHISSAERHPRRDWTRTKSSHLSIARRDQNRSLRSFLHQTNEAKYSQKGLLQIIKSSWFIVKLCWEMSLREREGKWEMIESHFAFFSSSFELL